MTENESDEPERVLFCLGAKSRIRRFFAWLGKLVCAFWVFHQPIRIFYISEIDLLMHATVSS